MRVVVQRSKNAKVTVNGEITGQISKGLVLLVGVTHDDKEEDAVFLAEKIVNLRIFEDDAGTASPDRQSLDRGADRADRGNKAPERAEQAEEHQQAGEIAENVPVLVEARGD